MKSWLESLRTAPDPMTPLQRRIVWILAVLVAGSRFMAISRTLWDWDEALFASALRDYDVSAHHPHPPGFPLFILFAKAVHLFVPSEFRSLQVVTVIGAVSLFPLMMFLARELRMRFTTAVIASLLLAFSPNVWFFGGTAFSDVPSLALSLLAVALLLRGCRSGNAYIAGAVVLGIAAGFRPQNLMIGMIPSLFATWCRIRATRSVRQPLVAIALGGGIVAASFGGAAYATGSWEAYRFAVEAHQEYITTIDSVASPQRPPLTRLFDDFFLRPYRMERLNIIMSILAGLGLLAAMAGRRPAALGALLIFGPFSMFGWLMLDLNSVSRFALAWMPMLTMLSAEGAAVAAIAIFRRQRPAWYFECVVALYLVATMVSWTNGALRTVRKQKSPPVQAVEWIRANLPKTTTLFIHGSMAPHAEFLLADYPRQEAGEHPAAPAEGGRAWLFREGRTAVRGGHDFTYRRNRLWQIARQRYFEVSVSPVLAQMRLAEGWHDEEGGERDPWHWMGAESRTLLQPFPAKNGRLTIQAYVPLDAVPPPTITVTWNGAVLDRFVATEEAFTRSWVVPSRDTWNELRLETTEIVNQLKRGTGHDGRDLGIRLDGLEWAVAE